MSNDEGVIADQDVFDDEPHDSLPFHDIERVGGASQSCRKSCESLGYAQKQGAVVGLVARLLGPPRAALVPAGAAAAFAREVDRVIRALSW